MTDQTKNSDWALYKRLFVYVLQHKAMYALAISGFVLYAASAPLLAHLMVVIEATYSDLIMAARF